MGYKALKVTPVNFSHLNNQRSCDPEELENLLGGEFFVDVEAQLRRRGQVCSKTMTVGPTKGQKYAGIQERDGGKESECLF